eukprot:1159488-Pelagomonas_calceolata.AAC.4
MCWARPGSGSGSGWVDSWTQILALHADTHAPRCCERRSLDGALRWCKGRGMLVACCACMELCGAQCTLSLVYNMRLRQKLRSCVLKVTNIFAVRVAAQGAHLFDLLVLGCRHGGMRNLFVLGGQKHACTSRDLTSQVLHMHLIQTHSSYRHDLHLPQYLLVLEAASVACAVRGQGSGWRHPRPPFHSWMHKGRRQRGIAGLGGWTGQACCRHESSRDVLGPLELARGSLMTCMHD